MPQGELPSYVQTNVIQQSSGSQTPELQGNADRVLVRFQWRLLAHTESLAMFRHLWFIKMPQPVSDFVWAIKMVNKYLS